MTNLDVSLRLKLINQLKGPSSDAVKDIDRIKKSIAGVGNAKGGDQLAKDFKAATVAAQNSGRAVDYLKAKVSELGRSSSGAAKLKSDLAGVSAEADRAARSLQKTKAAARSLNAASGSGQNRDANSSLKEKARNKRASRDDDEKGLKEKVEEAAVHKASHVLKTAAGAYTVEKVLEKTVGKAVEIEAALTQAKISMKGEVTPQRVDNLLNLAKSEAGRYGLPLEEVVKSLGKILADGVPEEQLGAFSNLAAKGATALNVPIDDMAHQLAILRNQTQANVADLEQYVNRVSVLKHSSPVSASEIMEMTGRARQPAEGANIDEKATMAIVTARRAGGTDPETSATFLRNFAISVVQAASGEGRGAEKKETGFEDLGMSAEQFMKDLKENSTAALDAFLEKLSASDNKTGIATKIAGNYGVTPLLSLAKERATFNKFAQEYEEAPHKTSQLDQALKIQQDTTKNRAQRASSRSEGLFESIGRNGLPILNRILDDMAFLSEKRPSLGPDYAKAENTAALKYLFRGYGDSSKEPASEHEIRIAAQADMKDAQDKMIARADQLADVLDRLKERMLLPGEDGRARAKNVSQLTDEVSYAQEDARRVRQGRNEASRNAELSKSSAAGVSLSNLADIPKAAADAASAAAKIFAPLSADQTSSAENAMAGYVAALQLETQKAIAIVTAAVAKMKSELSFTASPTIAPTISPALPAPPAKGEKHSSRSTSLSIQTAHFHGVQNVRSLHASLSREADRAARGKVNDALHDVG